MANRVFISGNLGTDIKVTYTAGKGTPVGRFSVGVNEYNSQTKQNETITNIEKDFFINFNFSFFKFNISCILCSYFICIEDVIPRLFIKLRSYH